MNESVSEMPRTLRERSLLPLGTAVAVALLAFPAFTRTYWSPMATGTLELHPAIHLHAVLFFGWLALLITQAWLAYKGRRTRHRALGMVGIALAASMVFSGVMAAIVGLEAGLDGPRPSAVRLAAGLSFGGMLLFSGFVIAAMANLRRPEWHQRLMIIATLGILQAAIARWIMLIPSIAQPTRVFLGAVIVDALLVGVGWMDARQRGRLHPAWIIGLAAILFVQWLRVAIQPTEAWITWTQWLARL